jgi:hypothetical protein
MTQQELHDVIEAYVRGKVPRQAILTSLGDVAQALVEVGAKLGFDMPGIHIRIRSIRPGEPPIRLAGSRSRQ